jgi:release factor glutamine methyltransferase
LSAIAETIHETALALAGAGIAEARREARLLLAAAAGLDAATVIAHPEMILDPAQGARLAGFTRRRAAGEPISRILGWREFWSLRFALGPDTLDPRPDSESLIAAALELADPARALSILDLGTGSGCLLLALLSELPEARGVGVDLSPGAVAVASANALSLGLDSRSQFRQGDWGSGIGQRFDLVLCNPPYIPAGEVAGLTPEVAKFDPILALAGGIDGLDAYRRLSSELPSLLLPGGRAIVEVGAGQADSAAAILAGGGLVFEGRRLDLAGIPRCLILTHAPAKVGGMPKQTPKNSWKSADYPLG